MYLQCNQISKTYNNKILALDNVTLDIKSGICGLLGTNGAGKTTLMQILTTILQPDKGGSVYYNGKNIDSFRKQYRSILGYVPQECGLPEHIKVRSLLLLLAQFKQIKFKDAKEQIDKLLKILNLDNKSNSYIKELSGGMKQRLSIAQGFLGEPELIVLDEPTRGLDIDEQERLYNFITQYSHKIIVVSSHIIQDIEAICSSVIIIHEGKMLYSGLIQTLLDYYSKNIFETQTDRNISLRDVYLHLIKSGKILNF